MKIIRKQLNQKYIHGYFTAQRSVTASRTHFPNIFWSSRGQEPAETISAPALAISAHRCTQPATAKQHHACQSPNALVVRWQSWGSVIAIRHNSYLWHLPQQQRVLQYHMRGPAGSLRSERECALQQHPKSQSRFALIRVTCVWQPASHNNSISCRSLNTTGAESRK